MYRIGLASAYLLLLSVSGCTWQANNASQAVDINPFNYGSAQPVVAPSNGYGYIDGQAQDMRTKR